MYGGFGIIMCDYCNEALNNRDYIIVKDKAGVIHYCNETCKDKHQNKTK